jgi:glycosyltransferase involved in cell wall biosynthesis
MSSNPQGGQLLATDTKPVAEGGVRGPIKILLLAPPPHLKGPLPKHTPTLVASLRDLGCEVVVANWGRRNDVESLGEKLWGRIDDIRRVRRVLVRVRPNILVVKTSHDWNTLVRDVLLLIATRHRRSCTVLQLHGSRPEALISPGNVLFKRMSRWLVQMSNAVLLLSTEEQVQWQRFYPAGRFYRVANPFAHHGEPPASPHASLSRVLGPHDPGVPLLLFVGRLMREKGILDLLYAMATIRDATPARLLAVGDGPLASELAALVRALDLQDRVVMSGYLHGEELEAAYAAATAFVLPTWWIEGFPTVIAEAMHAGLPIVTTPLRGMADHLEEQTNALFVVPRDPAALAGALLRLLSDRSLCTTMGAANREALKKFAPHNVGQEYLAVLQSIAAEDPATCT